MNHLDPSSFSRSARALERGRCSPMIPDQPTEDHHLGVLQRVLKEIVLSMRDGCYPT